MNKSNSLRRKERMIRMDDKMIRKNDKLNVLFNVTMSEGLKTFGQLTKEDLDDIWLSGSRELVKRGYDGSGQRFGIIDTGINPDHPEFAGKEVHLYNTTYYGKGLDDNGHGTHCAASAVGNAVGIAPNCNYVASIKAVDVFGTTEPEWLIEAANIANTLDLDVLSISLGVPKSFFSPEQFALFSSILKSIEDSGCNVIVACGNLGSSGPVLYPGGYEHVTAIGAVDENFTPAAFSSVSEEVDFCQVGVDVWSAWYKGGYKKMNGTSMATPKSAGFALCVRSMYQSVFERRPEEMLIHNMLKMYSVRLDAKGWDNVTGFGFLTVKPSLRIIDIELDLKDKTIDLDKLGIDANSGWMTVDSKKVDIPVPPILLEWCGRTKQSTVLPIRAFLEAFDIVVRYSDGKVRLVG